MSGESLRARAARLLALPPGTRVGVSYVLRTTCAAVASLWLSRALHIANPIWAVVSSVVVILPEVQASVSSALLRTIANLVGAAAGLAISFLHLPPTASLIAGLLTVALLCRLIGIDAAARTASVAVIIVLLKDPYGVRTSSESRVALVMLGCGVALAVTVLATQIERAIGFLRGRGRRSYTRDGEPKSDPTENAP
jgi:uncharacterized membrane protein YgaE (UPF0421/DUF939 family)